MQIKVWSGFSKRINSTKQPTGGTTVDVLLKAETDIKNPSFILTSTDFTINYVMAFGNYYFCTPVNLDASRLELKCTMDYLATFKANVGSYSGLIEYTSSSSNVMITDPRNKPTMAITATTTSDFAFNIIDFENYGVYILGVLSKDANGINGVLDYYALTPGQMALFNTELNDQGFWNQVDNYANGIQSCLVSCVWLPLNISSIPGIPDAISIGNATMNTNGKRMIGRVLTGITTGLHTINFSANSGGAGANMTYLEKAPFATGILYLPFVGFVELDLDAVAFTKNIQIDASIDLITGDIAYMLKYGGNQTTSYNGNIATKMPLSTASYDAVGTASGVIGIIGGAITAVAGIATGGLGAVAAGIGTMVASDIAAHKSLVFHGQTNGSISSALGAFLYDKPYVIIYQYEPTVTNLLDFKTTHGMPYFEVATVSSLSGFVKCADASVTIPGDGSEQDVVNGYMNSGFYYE